MAVNKAENITKKEADRPDEIVMNRIIMMFMVAAVAIVYLISIGKTTALEMLALYENRLSGILPPAICLVLFIAALVFFGIRRSRGVDDRLKSLNSYNLVFYTALLLWVTLPSWLFYRADGVTRLLLITVIAVTILYFVYYLYQREFFVYSFFSAVGACLIYIGSGFPVRLAILAVGVIAAFAAVVLRNGKGEFKLGSRSFKIAPYNATFVTYLILGAVTLAAGAALIFALPTLYVMIGYFVVYIAMGVYYTIKLI